MNILLSTDNNYVMPTGVLMTSIGYNNGSDVSYYILVNEEFTNDSRDALARVAEKFGNAISFYTILPEMVKDFPFGRADQPTGVTIATYYRLFITKILPDDVNKILYLDGDMIVRHSIKALWDENIDDFAVGVVHDCDEYSESKDNRLPYPMKEGYFNAGMLLINVEYWRENKCYDLFVDFAMKNSDKIIYHDQDVLNATLWDKKKWVSLSYNFQSSFILKPEYINRYTERLKNEINITKYDPAIIHYVANNKPWSLNCFMGYRSAWRYYWRKTEWKKCGLKDDTPITIKERLRNFALRQELFYPETKFEKIILRK